jgi:hypothetical protein
MNDDNKPKQIKGPAGDKAMNDLKDLSEEIVKYPVGSAVIRYRSNGVVYDWAVGIGGPNNQETLKMHLAYWRPDAEFIDCAINRETKP